MAADAFPIQPVTLVGSVVELQPLRPEHALGIASAYAPGTMDLFSVDPAPEPVDESSAQAWIAEVLRQQDAGQRVAFAVIERASGDVVGTTSYLRIDPAIPRVEVGGTWYAPDRRGTSVNPDAKLLVLGHAFERLGCACVMLLTSLWNERSQRAIERLGARRDGVLRGERRQRDGRIRDTVCYSILADEWAQVRAGLEQRIAGERPPVPVDEGLVVRRAAPTDAVALAGYLRRNEAFHAPFSPLRSAGWDHDAAVRERLEAPDRIQFLALRGERVVGQCAISNVAPAAVFRSCTIGYDVDHEELRRGIATRLVDHVVREALQGPLQLHRVEAGTLIDNLASQRVLERCGFHRIGISPRHVRIAGRWRDHELYAITAEDLEEQPR